MNLLQAAVLGVTQGLTEFLPVSSSGHLILVPWAFGWDDVLADEGFNKAFDVALHIGTFAGAAWYLRRDVARLVRSGLRVLRRRRVETHDERLALWVAASAVPAALIGALFSDAITERLGDPWQIAALLAVFGVLLWVVDRRVEQRTTFHELTGKQAAAMSVGQALALAPGVSRSGITMTMGRWLGVERDGAARFSFLISLPVTFGAVVYQGVDLLKESDPLRGQGGAFAVGIAFSAVTGALAVWGFLASMRRRGMGAYALYRVVVAVAVLLAIASNVREGTV